MKLLEILLLPFSFLYGGIMDFRNYLYDKGIRKSFRFDSCVVGIGNLSAGGAGKTPMTEYLIRLFSRDYHVTTLSRGYGRKTRGFRLADEDDSARTIGDEPYQYFRKFTSVRVAVGEERAVAIPFILAEVPETDIILMDDAFQHRAVAPDFQLLVTEYSRRFTHDHLLPAGRLRESRTGAARADVIVVSKCPENIPQEEQELIQDEISRYAPGIPVYFTSVMYEEPVRAAGAAETPGPVILVTGIADPRLLAGYLDQRYEVLEHLIYPDHHSFSESDISRITQKLESANATLITTEKDLMRFMLPEIWDRLSVYPVFYIPIQVRFLHDRDKFDEMMLKVIESKCS